VAVGVVLTLGLGGLYLLERTDAPSYQQVEAPPDGRRPGGGPPGGGPPGVNQRPPSVTMPTFPPQAPVTTLPCGFPTCPPGLSG
jgi:hypothetical protein